MAITSCGENRPTFFLGQGNHVVHKLVGNSWKRLTETNIYLPPGTLVFGELTTEYRGTAKANTLHIVDAHVFAFRSLRPKPLWKRFYELRTRLNYLNNKYVCFRLPKPVLEMPGVVLKLRRQWATIDSNKKVLVMDNPKGSNCKIAGILMIHENHALSAGIDLLFWNWTKDTHAVVNGQGDRLNFAYFEHHIPGGNNRERKMIYSSGRVVDTVE